MGSALGADSFDLDDRLAMTFSVDASIRARPTITTSPRIPPQLGWTTEGRNY